jgi:hypothetical protein
MNESPGSYDLNLRKSALETYREFFPAEEEVDLILLKVRDFLMKTQNDIYLHWKGNSEDHVVDHARKQAIMYRLGINADGSAVPLTFIQWLMYGTPRGRLIAKLNMARNKVRVLVLPFFHNFFN